MDECANPPTDPFLYSWINMVPRAVKYMPIVHTYFSYKHMAF